MMAAAALTACTTICGCSGESGAGKVSTLRFDVQGMHCNGCVTAIGAEVTGVSGVKGVRVSLEGHSAEVDVTDPAVAPEVQKAISSLGYKVNRVDAP